MPKVSLTFEVELSERAIAELRARQLPRATLVALFSRLAGEIRRGEVGIIDCEELDREIDRAFERAIVETTPLLPPPIVKN